MNLYRVLRPLWAVYGLLATLTLSTIRVESSPSLIPQFTSQEVVFVPVVIHLVHNPKSSLHSQAELEARVSAQIQQLNEDFCMLNDNFYDTNLLPKKLRKQMGAARIQFYLAPEQPNGSPSSDPKTGSSLEGVTYTKTKIKRFVPDEEGPHLFHQLKQSQHGHAAWDSKRYLNIWVAEVEEYSGLAQYPWQYYKPNGPLMDGIVVDVQAFGLDANSRGARVGGRTLTHEIGHWLGLLHPFHLSRSGEDDFIPDTPVPSKGESTGYLTWNTAPPARSHTGQKHQTHGKAFFMNFMDYTWDDCRNSFTKDQVARMQSVFTPFKESQEFNPEYVKGSRSYFEFPGIQPEEGHALVCQRIGKVFKIPNIPANFVSWKASENLELVGPTKHSNHIKVKVATGLGSGSGELIATIKNPQGCGSKKLVIPVEIFSPRIVGPEDPGGKPNQYILDAESRIHVSQYKWSVSPGLELTSSHKALVAKVEAAPASRSGSFLQLIHLNIDTDCAGKISLAREAPTEWETSMPFTLSPNPAQDYLALSWASNQPPSKHGYRVRLSNLNGNTVFLGSGRGNNYRLETGRFSRGMYQLEISKGKDRYSQRVMLE
ncbi:MAG: M43 family zinc metalloprotease [Bacteroidota bacterium]